MARLNTHTSATPQSRATTVDTLYRDPTPAGANTRARQSTTYSVMSPGPSIYSDKENESPESRQNTPQSRIKRKVMAGPQARLPTPDSAESANPNKRRRVSNELMSKSNFQTTYDAETGVYEDGEDEEVEGDEGDDDDVIDQGLPTPTDAQIDEFGSQGAEEAEEGSSAAGNAGNENDDDDPVLRYYNPHQNPEKRRQIRTSYRTLQRELDDNRDEYIKPGSKRLNELIPQATRVFGKVRMTSDAVLDSQFLTSVTDLSSKQLKNSVNQGTHGIGVDVDQFVSRCIFFMKEGRPPGAEEDTRTQARSIRQTRQDEEDEDGDGDGLDWAFLGRHACFPSNKRPPLSSFLLGPLSVQRRVRTVTARRATQRRQPQGPTTRPQEIKLDEIQKNENASLTHMVETVRGRLKDHIQNGMEALGDDIESEEEFYAVCQQHRVYPNMEMEPAVSLFDFAINPNSFGQTVENLFYVSFLIREGSAKVETDKDGLPLLIPQVQQSLDERREQQVEKRQAIFSIDYATWKTLIEAFDIKTPLIPHREVEEVNVASGGWYS